MLTESPVNIFKTQSGENMNIFRDIRRIVKV